MTEEDHGMDERRPTPEEMFAESVQRYGIEHTHDVTCRTWRGDNWAGACDCTLDARTGYARRV